MRRNRLAQETSPYLLQHADNPVDWYPWGEAALARAKLENKPILLSVGYSACHWCHVMAHESFEDADVAALMNQWFVNIKVDREERPDLDRIYQVAQQLITHRGGGWPLTLFLAPEDQRPFFGGTYFPKEPRQGMPGFADILRRVAEYFHGHTAEIRTQNEQLALAFERLEPARPAGHVTLDDSPLVGARRSLDQTFDARFGGFGPAPKFPHPGSIERCLRQWHVTSRNTDPDLKALYMATLTLTRMGEGGIFDQLGGGFSRYSVDEFWMIPHFEKMLYDNGLLLAVYACAAVATGEGLFARIAADVAAWLLRDMRSPEGGFYSSLDADSEGHEGRFYVWDRAEIRALLTPAEYALVVRRFGLDGEPNFEGRWHLHAHESLESLANVSANGSPSAAKMAEMGDADHSPGTPQVYVGDDSASAAEVAEMREANDSPSANQVSDADGFASAAEPGEMRDADHSPGTPQVYGGDGSASGAETGAMAQADHSPGTNQIAGAESSRGASPALGATSRLDAAGTPAIARMPNATGMSDPARTLETARAKLLAARNLRVWPARDEKVLTSWNALAIKGLAIAGRALGRPDLIDAATAAVDFIRHKLWRGGRLLATYKDGRAHLSAYLDDYAFLADALLELLQSRWRSRDLHFARELLEVLLAAFEDPAGGGFYFTASDHERLMHRGKTFSDDSLPCGNGVAASVLCKMGYLLGELRYVNAAERTFEAGWEAMREYPQAHMAMLNALEDCLIAPQIIIVRGAADAAGTGAAASDATAGAGAIGAGAIAAGAGDTVAGAIAAGAEAGATGAAGTHAAAGASAAGAAGAAEATEWARTLRTVYAPTRMIFAIPADATDLPAALADKRSGMATTAYLCTGMTCSAPLTDLSELARTLTSRIDDHSL